MNLPKITGKQVGLVYAKFAEKGIRGDKAIMEWLEFELGIQVFKLEEIQAGQLDMILKKLERV